MAGPRKTGVRLLMINYIRQRPRTGVLIFLPLILALLFLVKLPFLVVADSGGHTVLTLPLTGNKEFSLYYLHSVHKTPVWENFSVKGNKLMLTSTVFESLGVGIPFLPGEGHLDFEGGKITLRGLNRSFDEISMALTPVAEQALLQHGKRYNFNDYFKSGDLFRIYAARISPGKVMWLQVIRWGGIN